jgi:hypothetical protein
MMAKKVKRRSTASRAAKAVTKAARATGRMVKKMIPGKKKARKKSSQR